MTRDIEPGLRIADPDSRLYNPDLAPVEAQDRRWRWFEIWSVWSSMVHSLLGYTLAASLFFTYGLNSWAVFAAIVTASFIILLLVNLSGQPSVRYGVPYPVMARASMGVEGAKLPAVVRGVVAIFWYGAQTYVASTAVALLITSIIGPSPPDAARWLGLNAVGWIALLIVWSVQTALLWRGIEWIRVFIDWAAPAVYAVMIVLALILWSQAGDPIFTALGSAFRGEGSHPGGPVMGFLSVIGTMLAFYAPVILNYGDFTRYTRSRSAMRIGNLLGLPLNNAFFAFIALFVTAGTVVVFGDRLVNPTEIISRVDSLPLTIVATLTFFAATIGINVVANFVPPANDFSNLFPDRIGFRGGGAIASAAALVIAALSVTVISRLGITGFINTLGAVTAPAYGIMVADYYLIRSRRLHVADLYSSRPDGLYHYTRGWNVRAVTAFAGSPVFSVLCVWLPSLGFLAGFDWIIGALLGGGLYLAMMRRMQTAASG